MTTQTVQPSSLVRATATASARAVVCVRVSPRPADKVKYSPEIQEQKCRDWCDQRGIPVVRVIQDILVSGGSVNRFDSILGSIKQDRPSHFIVSDITRWTRDHPGRFWAMQEILRSEGVLLVPVDQEYLSDPDMPFGATLTTAHVEMAYQERLVLKRKTREGMARAKAAGKRWGRIFGWTRKDGGWVVDEPRIRYLYQSVIDGLPYREISKRLGIHWHSCIPQYIRADAQRDVVGDQMWLRANEQVSRRQRAPRIGAKWSSIYRGLLIGPCGENLVQTANNWGNYQCARERPHPQTFSSLSAPKHVNPVVRDLLGQLRVPHQSALDLQLAETPLPESPAPDPVAVRDEMDRLTLQYGKGRLSERVYETRIAELEAQLSQEPQVVPARPPEERVEVIRTLRYIDLMDMDPETGDIANRLLRELLYPIHVGWDKRPIGVKVREEYRAWFIEG